MAMPSVLPVPGAQHTRTHPPPHRRILSGLTTACSSRWRIIGPSVPHASRDSAYTVSCDRVWSSRRWPGAGPVLNGAILTRFVFVRDGFRLEGCYYRLHPGGAVLAEGQNKMYCAMLARPGSASRVACLSARWSPFWRELQITPSPPSIQSHTGTCRRHMVQPGFEPGTPASLGEGPTPKKPVNRELP